MGSLCPKAPNWGFLSFQSVSLSFQSVNRLSELSSKFNFFPVQQKPYLELESSKVPPENHILSS